MDFGSKIELVKSWFDQTLRKFIDLQIMNFWLCELSWKVMFGFYVFFWLFVVDMAKVMSPETENY